MTGVGWSLILLSGAALGILSVRAPKDDARGLWLIMGSLAVFVCGMVIVITNTHYEPIPQRTSAVFVAPIAGMQPVSP